MFAFEVDGMVALISAFFGGLVLLGWLWSRKHSHLLFSSLSSWKGGETLRARLSFLPGLLKGVAFGLMLCALPDPRLSLEVSRQVGKPPIEEVDRPTEGVALYLVLDQSGSMEKRMSGLSRLETLKQVTREFILARSSDMIGLVSFARIAHVLSPLTLDRVNLLEQIDKLNLVQSSREDGTAIGYAIFKTANLIAATRHFAQEMEAAYEIKGAAMVLVTDGIQNPHPLDRGHELREMGLEQAASYAAEQGIKLYLINVEPIILYPQYARQRGELEQAAEVTGGKFFVAGDSEALAKVYQEIDEMERSRLPSGSSVKAGEQRSTHQLQLYPYLVGVGLLFLFSAISLQCTWLRRAL